MVIYEEEERGERHDSASRNSLADFGTSIPMATLGEGHEIVIHRAGAGRREA